jgi:hypothetical protein
VKGRSGFSPSPLRQSTPLSVLASSFSDVASQKQGEKAVQYNRDRAKWREQVSVLRKQYAEEESIRKEEERKRREALATDIAIRKAENMRKKLARSEVTAKRVAIERAAATAKFEAHVAEMDKVRASRKHDQDARLRAMVAYLEEQSQLWLTPERIDLEINENFVNEQGIIGHCAERSPYWGFVPEVEDIKELIARIHDGEVPDLFEEEKPEPMELFHDYMLSASQTYREYKHIRESEGDIQGVLDFFKETDFVPAEDDYRGNGKGELDDEFNEEFDDEDDVFPSRNLGGGVIGRFAKPRSMFDQDEQNIAEQLARLRARRLRPPSSPTK